MRRSKLQWIWRILLSNRKDCNGVYLSKWLRMEYYQQHMRMQHRKRFNGWYRYIYWIFMYNGLYIIARDNMLLVCISNYWRREMYAVYVIQLKIKIPKAGDFYFLLLRYGNIRIVKYPDIIIANVINTRYQRNHG